MSDRPCIPSDSFARAQTIAGLRQLADFLEDHPELPVPPYGWELSYYTRADSDAEERAEVDRIAAVLDPVGGALRDDTGDGGHYIAAATFARVAYRAVHIPRRRRESYEARHSYTHNIVIDEHEGAAA